MARKPVDLTNQRFGRLIAVNMSERRTSDGKAIWNCLCDCGNTKLVQRSNLKTGNVQSCGCLGSELSARRRVDSWVPLPFCSVAGCKNAAEEYDRTLCCKHAQRFRRYGDASYVTPKDVSRMSNREAQLKNVTEVKSTTYRKLLGRHEHRVIGERIAGRSLRPDEHVHHIDGNKHNNDPSNLQVMSQVEHIKLHAREGKKHV